MSTRQICDAAKCVFADNFIGQGRKYYRVTILDTDGNMRVYDYHEECFTQFLTTMAQQPFTSDSMDVRKVTSYYTSSTG